jgi:hypothetical protein
LRGERIVHDRRKRWILFSEGDRPDDVVLTGWLPGQKNAVQSRRRHQFAFGNRRASHPKRP